MDKEIAKQSLATFPSGKMLMANQIKFINLIINYLTEHGTIDIALLYESSFTDITSNGPDGLFNPDQVNELIVALEQITATAVISPGQQQIIA